LKAVWLGLAAGADCIVRRKESGTDGSRRASRLNHEFGHAGRRPRRIDWGTIHEPRSVSMGIRARACVLMVACLTLTDVAMADVSIVFSKDEIAIIQDYYAHHPAALDAGPQQGKKSKGLPPGIAKNLARGKPLPPGIAKTRLPSDLVRQLPPVYPGYERVVVDGRVLLVEIATQIIHDVLMEAVN
jgi:hypothetical protein